MSTEIVLESTGEVLSAEEAAVRLESIARELSAMAPALDETRADLRRMEDHQKELLATAEELMRPGDRVDGGDQWLTMTPGKAGSRSRIPEGFAKHREPLAQMGLTQKVEELIAAPSVGKPKLELVPKAGAS